MSEQDLLRKMANIQSALAEQEKNFWAYMSALAAQSLANASAGIHLGDVPIVDDLGYFSGQPEYLSKNCPVHGAGKCFLFQFPTLEGVSKLVHAKAMPYKLTDFGPLNKEQQTEYNLALAENGLPMRDLSTGLDQTGTWMADNVSSLVSQWQRLDNNRRPALPSDGSTGMLGHHTEQRHPGVDDASGLAGGPGGSASGPTEPKVEGGDLS
jgi:hypothetical protein